jgi:hypothetical protein
MSVQFKTVDEFAVGQRLDNYLLKHLKGVPKSHIYRVIRKQIQCRLSRLPILRKTMHHPFFRLLFTHNRYGVCLSVPSMDNHRFARLIRSGITVIN